MPDFRFQQFGINHDRSTLKVGTDAVLLGALAPAENSAHILDIGTGCGVIALMLAQRAARAQVVGIDVDSSSVQQARENGAASPWKERLHFQHCTAQAFAKTSQRKFDLIVSNPPFFTNSLKSPHVARNLSKHNDALSFDDLAAAVAALLTNDGRFSLILPAAARDSFVDLARARGLHCVHTIFVKPLPYKPANRVVMTFSFHEVPEVRDVLTIRTESNNYSEEYLAVVKNFLLGKES